MKISVGGAVRGALPILAAALIAQLPQPAMADSSGLELMQQVLLGHAAHSAAAPASHTGVPEALTDDAQALARRALIGSPRTEVVGLVGPAPAGGADETTRAHFLAHDDAQAWARRALQPGRAPTGS
jgi:hypothetical protein